MRTIRLMAKNNAMVKIVDNWSQYLVEQLRSKYFQEGQENAFIYSLLYKDEVKSLSYGFGSISERESVKINETGDNMRSYIIRGLNSMLGFNNQPIATVIAFKDPRIIVGVEKEGGFFVYVENQIDPSHFYIYWVYDVEIDKAKVLNRRLQWGVISKEMFKQRQMYDDRKPPIEPKPKSQKIRKVDIKDSKAEEIEPVEPTEDEVIDDKINKFVFDKSLENLMKKSRIRPFDSPEDE